MLFLPNFAVYSSCMGLKLQLYASVTFKYKMKVKENDQRSKWKTSFFTNGVIAT